MVPVLAFVCVHFADLPEVTPKLFTAPVGADADDPAILARGERTLILGTDKTAAPEGGLYVFELNGQVVSKFVGLDRPNNVDVIPGFLFGGEEGDLAVVTERFKKRLRCFRVGTDGALTDLSGSTDVFIGWPEVDREPMGVATAQWGGVARAWVSPKTGPKSEHFERGTLAWNPVTQKVDYRQDLRFGYFSGKKETESLKVDVGTKRIYCSDEGAGIWSFDAETGMIQGFISNPLHTGDHEGLATTRRVLINSDQRVDKNVFWAYRLSDHSLLGGFSSPVDDTDGIDLSETTMGKDFPQGIMVAMNSKGKNFAIFDLRDVLAAVQPR